MLPQHSSHIQMRSRWPLSTKTGHRIIIPVVVTISKITSSLTSSNAFIASGVWLPYRIYPDSFSMSAGLEVGVPTGVCSARPPKKPLSVLSSPLTPSTILLRLLSFSYVLLQAAQKEAYLCD